MPINGELLPVAKPSLQKTYLKHFQAKRVLQGLEREDDLGDEMNFYENELLWSMVQHIQSRDIFVHHLYAKALTTHDKKIKIELMKELNHMMLVDEVFSLFLE